MHNKEIHKCKNALRLLWDGTKNMPIPVLYCLIEQTQLLFLTKLKLKYKISEPNIGRGVLFEFHLKFWNTASIGIPARSLL